jgi:hypothetical protein
LSAVVHDLPASAINKLQPQAVNQLPLSAVNAKLISLIASGAIGIGILLSGFVISEPAPYEIYMAGLIAVWRCLASGSRAPSCRCWCCWWR